MVSLLPTHIHSHTVILYYVILYSTYYTVWEVGFDPVTPVLFMILPVYIYCGVNIYNIAKGAYQAFYIFLYTTVALIR